MGAASSFSVNARDAGLNLDQKVFGSDALDAIHAREVQADGWPLRHDMPLEAGAGAKGDHGGMGLVRPGQKCLDVGDRLGVDHGQRRLARRRVLVASVRLARVEVIGEFLAKPCAQLVKPDIEHNCLLTTAQTMRLPHEHSDPPIRSSSRCAAEGACVNAREQV